KRPSWTPSKIFWARASERPAREPAALSARRSGCDRAPCARVRSRLLPHRVRGARLSKDERGGGLRRLSDPLSALAVWHGVRGAVEGLHLWPVQDLRDGHQQQSRLCLSFGRQLHRRSEDGDGARVRPCRLLQKQLLLLEDQSQNDRRHGQPC